MKKKNNDVDKFDVNKLPGPESFDDDKSTDPDYYNGEPLDPAKREAFEKNISDHYENTPEGQDELISDESTADEIDEQEKERWIATFGHAFVDIPKVNPDGKDVKIGKISCTGDSEQENDDDIVYE